MGRFLADSFLFWLVSYNGFVFTILKYKQNTLKFKTLGLLKLLFLQLQKANSSTMQTKCILFCHKKNIYNNLPSIYSVCSWIKFWVQTFMCILTVFFSGTNPEVLTFPFDYFSLVAPCCGFWSTLIGGCSWLSCLRLLRTPYACWHEGGSGSCLHGFWSFALLGIKEIFLDTSIIPNREVFR